MQKQFPKNYQKEQAENIFSSTTNTNNNYFASLYNCCQPYYHSHSYHQKKSTTTTAAVTSLSQKRTLQKNPFFIIIVALLSLCAMTVSEVVTSSPTTPFVRDHPSSPPQTPRSPFTNSSIAANPPSPALVHPNETLAPEIIYANESWWPKSIPTELFHSNRGTLQQQIIGVPPSWGVGCPTPGSTPPVRSSSSNNTTIKSNSNKLNYMMKMKEAENDYRPYDRCPKPCPVISTINNILNINKNELNSPSSNNINNNKNSSRSSSIIKDSNINYSSKNKNNTTTDQQQQQIKEENNKHPLYFNQCLHYLQPSVFETLCKTDNQSISEFGWKISELRLPFCCEHTVESVVMASLEKEDFNVMLSEVDDDFNNEVPVRLLRDFECRRHLEALLMLDRLARKAAALFDSVLQRYDCGQIYSVHFRCEDCKDAYRRWVCASLLPYHEPRSDPAELVPPPEPSTAASDTTVASFPTSGDGEVSEESSSSSRPARARMRGKRRRRTWRKVRPCRNVCQQVEQRCPFFLPGDRAPGYTTQYAGEPTFLCLDPNIPETGEQFLRSPYGPDDCCFRYCDTAESIAVMMMHTTSSKTNFSSASTGPTTTSSTSSSWTQKSVLRHGVCSTTTACDQQENLLNYNKSYYYESDRMINSSTSSLNNSSANLLLSSSSTFNNNDNTNNIDKKVNNNDKQPHKQCSQLSNNEKVQWNCAVSPPSSSSSTTSSTSTQQQQQPQLTNSQQSVKINNNINNNNNNNNDIKSSHHHHHHHRELVVGSFQEKLTGKERTSGSGDIIDSRSAGVSFHIHYLINTAAAPVARKRRECLLWLLFPNNNNNNESITIRNRSLSSLSEWWWFSIVTIILRTIDFFIYFLAILPFMLLFLLVHKRSADGYL